MTQLDDLIQATLTAHIAPDAQLVAVQERPEGEQGFSGAQVQYYDVSYTRGGTVAQVTLVTKDAPLLERRTLAWMQTQALRVPFNQARNLTTNEPAPVCMQYLPTLPQPREQVQQVAQALAAIHAAGMQRADELSWLPRADPAFVDAFIINACWRAAWQALLVGGEYIDGFGERYGPPKPGGNFLATFATYTQPPEAAAARFLATVTELWDEGDSLTLVHADFHGDHVRMDADRAYIIDWGFAHYGSLYLDLPNYFSRDDVVLYRDALAALGHAIPLDTFLARYDAVRPYPGFKYFGIGLYNWCYGDPPHQRDNVMHFIDMVL
jgi:hypothetical protein